VKYLCGFSIFLMALTAPGHPGSSCDPDHTAIGSIFLEACQTERRFCRYFLSHYSNDSRSGYRNIALLPGPEQPVTEDMSYPEARRAILANQLHPNELARFRIRDGSLQNQRYFGNLSFVNNRVGLYHRGDYEQFHVFRDSTGNMRIYDFNEVKSLQKIPPQSYPDEVQNFLGRLGIRAGMDFVDAGTRFVIAEVEGKMVDETGEYIFTRVGDRIVRRPLSRLYSAVSHRLPTRAVSAARSVYRGGGRLAQALGRSPLAGALELSLAPSQAACTDLSTQFIQGLCSDDPHRFQRWFRELNSLDRIQVLEDPTSCQLVSRWLQEEQQRMRSAQERQRAGYEQRYRPQGLQCGWNQAAFELPVSTLGGVPGNERIVFRYTVDQVQQNGEEYNRITVEKRERGSNQLMDRPQQYVLTDDLPVRILPDNSVVQLPTSLRSYQQIESANVGLHRWLVERVARECSERIDQRLRSPEVEQPVRAEH
jgi:hypothetical protein